MLENRLLQREYSRYFPGGFGVPPFVSGIREDVTSTRKPGFW